MKKVLGLFIFFIALLTVGALGFYFYAKKALFEEREVNLSIKVEKGESVKSLIRKLKEAGVIDNPELLYLWAKRNRVFVKSGCYEIKGRYSAVKLLKEFEKGSPCLIKFTIIPGSTVFDVDRLFSSLSICQEGEILKLSKDKDFLSSLSIPFLEGYLYPDTYLVNKDVKCKQAVAVPIKRLKKIAGSLLKDYSPPEKVKKALGKEPELSEILTVASIVEKETSKEEERPLVAAVIYNRLIKGMKLQCDPTTIYALKLKGEEKKRLLLKDLKTPSPFNTYYASGLPPTPICNPSISSIRAALYPADVDYLYFVADGSGGHTFTKTYREHLKEVRKYRKWQRGS